MVNEVIDCAIKIAGSQKKLADACGVSQPTVWAWLHGEKKPSAENAKRIELATDEVIPAYRIRPDLTDLFPHPKNAA